jgi:GNAT superfamily N-acetyltransferase
VRCEQAGRQGGPEDRERADRPLRFREGSARWLGAESQPDLQALLERCREDLRLATGGDPDANDAREILTQRPPGAAEHQRLTLGVYDAAGALVAALDAYRDFPQPASWYVAVVLVRPDLRGRGLATGLLARLERLAFAEGGTAIHVIAPARHPAVLQLFGRAGYHRVREVALPLGGHALRGYHLARELRRAVTSAAR